MARIRHIFIILLMILWVSVSKAQPADVNDSITVSGLVKIGAIEPVIGASISEKGTSNRTLTDVDGRFNIKVPMGAKLVASCVGMDSAEVIVDGDSVLICMMPNRFSSIWVADGRGVLIPGFFGNIYDQDAQPLKGATITLLPSGKSVKTNHNGYFSFDDKKDDTIVRVECSGYEPVQGEFHRMDNCLTVRMEPEKASKHVLDENGKSKAQPATDVNGSITVTGQVIDRTDNDQPLIGASISEKGTSNRTTTDFDGRFIIKVPMGATLVASYIGLGTAEVLVDGEPILIRMLPQKFSCGPVCTSPYGIPDWGYKGVEGIIYDQDGHRLKGATVTLLPSGKSVKSDNDGYFSFDDKKDDTIVRVECSGYEPVQGEIQDNWITVRMDP